ncbi:MAG: VWA domain-containing protein [Kofleriaceae bacterium]
MALAVERLRAHPATSKVAILLTDGVETAGTLSARAAADLARDLGIKVYTIGAGTNGVAPVRVETRFGSQLVQAPVEIDEDTLRAVAERTGGTYFRATDRAGLEAVYAQIDRLERTRLEEDRFLQYREQYVAWLGAALALAVIALVLRATVLRRLP